MYKYIYLSLALLIGFQSPSAAQEIQNPERQQHIIHLHNGSSLIGVLIEYRDDRPVVIEVGDEERIEVPHAAIQSLKPITQKKVRSIIKKRKDITTYNFEESGWHFGSNLGLISRGSSSFGGYIGMSIDANATYHLSRLLGLGITTGYDSYGEGGSHDYLPIQLHVTGYLTPTKVSLFYSLGAGYSIPINDQENQEWFRQTNSGGLVVYPKIGVRLSAHDGVNTTLFTGIKIQNSTLERRWGEELEESIIQDRTFKRFIIGLGILF